ncbi:hypothetical protein [Candidatus Parabeggiatoa sp. HSG14]|uniref:hypothetical protein n=1 Tax=Candidatus Parabeggiatoa sp. HSG14 TaxID=3055593 RepID=UPI0025A6C487|nr:hypothetical protein [Thiotrichales bacterium HSG14]
MCKLCWGIVIVLIIALSGMVYKFIFQGSVEKSSDGRLAIQLEAGERDLVLSEMRAFLSSVQQITAGILNEDMKQVAEAAQKAGRGTMKNVPGSLIGKLPLSFKKLGIDTHRKFDALALDAEDLEDREHTLSQLSTLMENCVACHASYRIAIIPNP